MKFIDFFSGIGGFRLGMEMAGHECVGHCEIDKYADKSYRAMHKPKESEWYANDITRVEPGVLPDAECYCGGFPCQAFSIAGKRGGFDDTRGTLFFEVMRLARVRRPQYLFLENVKGLLSSKTTLNYAVIHSILLTDLSTWRQIWEENQSSQNLKYNLSTVIINYYLQEILGIELENQNPKLDHILKTISGLVSERTAQSQELGRAKSYRSYLTEIKQFTKKLNCSHTERQAQLEEKLFEVDSHIDLLISTDSLIQTDMNTLESIIHTLDDAESMLRKCLEEHYKTEKLFTILMGENQMTEPTTYLYVLQELSILTSIILRCKSSENLLSEVQLDSIEQKENMNYVNTFGVIIGYLSELGYDAEWQVLNSKDFGVPQNRERVFIIGHLGGRSWRGIFPINGTNGEDIKQLIGGSQGYRVYDPSGSSVTLASQAGGMGAKTGLYMVEDASKSGINVVGYTRESVIKDRTRILGTDGNCQALRATDYKDPAKIAVPVLTPDRAEKWQNGRRFKEDGEPMFTLTSQDRHGVLIKQATKQGFIEVKEGGVFDMSYPDSETRRGRVQEGGEVSPTVTANSQLGVVVGVVDDQGRLVKKCKPSKTVPTLRAQSHGNEPKIIGSFRIRKLTPKECFRLQGFPDEYYDRAAAVNSNSQLYKQAGNSVTVNVIYEIAKRLEDI